MMPETAVYDTLYQGVDYSALNWAEQMWVKWYVMIGNPIIATGLMSFLMHEVSRFRKMDAKNVSLIMLRVTTDCLFWTLHSLDHY